MEDVIRLHKATCPNYQPLVDLSLDGVQESKSSSLSADIYTVSFHGCKTVYPLRIIRPINKYKVNQEMYLRYIISDINLNNVTIKTAVMDNPKRAFVRFALSHGASYACEYCESKAEYVVTPDKAKGQLCWPFSTDGGPRRDEEKIKEITDKIVNGEIISRDDAKGFYGRSPFLFQENFNFISDIPAEYMHTGCLGMVKRMTELTFNVGENRARNTKRKLSDVSLFNQLISSIKSTREFSRRCRHLDFGVMKAQEYRNLSVFFFPLVVECIPELFSKERKLWLQIAFVLRSCLISNKEFDLIPNTLIKKTTKSFYTNYESLFGKKNCTYSIHMILSHILEIRGDKPMTDKSAFKYENFYSEIRNLFQPGTISPSKQILSNCYMKRLMENHTCERNFFFDTKKKGKEDNSSVYFIDENNEYQFFNIIKINDNETFTCNPQGKFVYKSDIVKDINWERVGVFKVGPYSEEKVTIPRKKIKGKVLRVSDFLITCPNNVLREQ